MIFLNHELLRHWIKPHSNLVRCRLCVGLVGRRNNWAVSTIMNKYRDEFEKRVKTTFVPVKMTIRAEAR